MLFPVFLPHFWTLFIHCPEQPLPKTRMEAAQIQLFVVPFGGTETRRNTHHDRTRRRGQTR
jgi:hypothetical protein